MGWFTAEWRLYGCGLVLVEGGSVNTTTSPWNAHRSAVTKIVFTENLTAGASLVSLFSGLNNLISIEGLEKINTVGVTNMSNMFNGASSLTNLNLSDWNTENVTNISSMFNGASSLTNLNLSGWNTTRITSTLSMSNTFAGASSLRQITLGANFRFVGSPGLPDVPTSFPYAGRWQNVGSGGTIENPRGQHIFTSAQFMSTYQGSMAGTWVWNRVETCGGTCIHCRDCQSCSVEHGGMFESGSGINGAKWRLYSCGMLVVTGGFINSMSASSPWNAIQSRVSHIVFSDAITVGTSLSGLFSGLSNVTEIDGLNNFDTARVTNMSNVFSNASRLTRIDLSSWNTDNVTNMTSMFSGTSSLRQLVLGENFNFIGSPGLHSVGLWRNVGAGTPDAPEGQYIFSAALFASRHQNFMADTWVWQLVNYCDNNPCSHCRACPCDMAHAGAFAAGDGIPGSIWRLYGCGLLVADSGFINNTSSSSPWNAHRSLITKIIFDGEITAGISLSGLFSNLNNLTSVTGLENVNTHNVTNMSFMFSGTSGLTEINFSNWNTINVTNMSNMFSDASGLTLLDLSGWNTFAVTNMSRMFEGASSLQQIILGETFRFVGSNSLPDVPSNADYAGVWQNVGTGTPDDPRGQFIFTSQQLMSHYHNSAAANTWVWRKTTAACTCTHCLQCNCAAAHTGAFANGAGGNGASWRMYQCGMVLVNGGFINITHSNPEPQSPWFSHREAVTGIIFTNNITAGTSLFGLFHDLKNLNVIEGLEFFDTRNVTNMSSMFYNVNRVIGLNLSSWNTENVTDMNDMFFGATSLRQIILGDDFKFIGSPNLPNIQATATYTGLWQNIGTGTIYNPQGGYSFTSATFMLNYNGLAMADTWVWQRTKCADTPCIHCADCRDCTVAHSGAFSDGGGTTGATWRLYGGCGFLVVDGGFIYNSSRNKNSPWDSYKSHITRIVFTDDITAGASLRALFSDLNMVETIEGLNNFNTKNVTDMSRMFEHASTSRRLDVSSWNTDNVTNMSRMFSDTGSLTTLEIFRCDAGSLTDTSFMFSGARSLSRLNLSDWNTENVKHMSRMFSGASGLTDIDLSDWNTENVMCMTNMFEDTSSLTSLDISEWDTYEVGNMSGMFSGASNLESLDLSEWDTGSVVDMSSMFLGASGLTELDLSDWDTDKVQNMQYMFSNANGLEALNLSGWDTTRVTQMSDMFSGASNLTELDLSDWDTSNVKRMSGMFSGASKLAKLDMSGWDTSNVEQMLNVFSDAKNLKNLDVSDWDTSKVTNMSGMFEGANSLENLDISEWDTGKVTHMAGMFSGANNLTELDLSNWNVSNVKNMSNMFSANVVGSEISTFGISGMSANAIESNLTVLNLSGWKPHAELDTTNMFAGAINLRVIVLSSEINFSGGSPNLPAIRADDRFTGNWQNVGAGTRPRPQGEHALSSANLIEKYHGDGGISDTWVWERRAGNVEPILSVSPIFAYPGDGEILLQFWVDDNPGVAFIESRIILPKGLTWSETNPVSEIDGLTVARNGNKFTVTGAGEFSQNGKLFSQAVIVSPSLQTDENLEIILDRASSTNANNQHYFTFTINGEVLVQPAILGNVSGSGQLTSADMVLLARYLVGHNVIINLRAADVNGDGVVNSDDITHLLRMLVGRIPV
ncbi:MAG: BspA family leucine-rich repeat surface protein [Defluviitaleaceae bacterium]|nr:BspA family leucine-rich repeat surface protein [Defluviitaleaceae bacterium]